MKHPVKLTFIIILVYGFWYLSFFWQTPLGQTPVLDGTENILLAKQIATNSLPQEPFFRSMLYPALLAIPCILGFDSTEELFMIASFSGMVFHFISAIFVFLSVKNLWNNLKAAIIAALIYGLYPPAVFFAGEPLDTTISISFMLAALYTFLLAADKESKALFASSGLLLGIACLLRSNLLPFGIIYLAYPAILYRKKTIINCFFSIICLSFLMLLNGSICYYHSGEFRLLPWQGASNFYSANSQRANGKFYRHTVYIPNRPVGVNPARLEAEYIYSIETGKRPPFDLNDFNRFWLNKSISEIKSNPYSWIKLTLKKIYYLYNNYEQYNNKTFGFHKQITPSLRYNPLCFGLLIIFVFIFIFNSEDKIENEKLLTIAFAIDALSLGIIAFYVSSRFRLPIASLLIIFSSGLFTYKFSELINKKNIIITIIVSLFTFSNFFNVADTSTWKEDRLLNAFACSRLGLDEEQVLWTDRVLEEDPYNLQAIRLKLVGFTNLALSGQLTDQHEWQKVIRELKYLSKNKIYFDDTQLLLGCYLWKYEKDKEKAYEIWLNSGCESLQPELFQALMIYTGLVEPNDSDKKMAKLIPLLAAAIEGHNNTNNLNSVEIQRAKSALNFLL